MVSECSKHVDTMRLKGYQFVAFLLDQDNDNCPPETARRLGAVRGDKDVLVSVIVLELEAWLLADDDALGQLGVHGVGTGYTDFVDDPKRRLKELFIQAKRRERSETEIVNPFGQRFSLERAAQRNHSARRFVNKLQNWAPSGITL